MTYNTRDGKQIIDAFSSSASEIAQSWKDDVGKKTAAELNELIQMMSDLLNELNKQECTIQRCVEMMLEDCGKSSVSGGEGVDYDALLKGIHQLLDLVDQTQPDDSSDSGGRHSSYGGNGGGNNEYAGYDNYHSNNSGTTLGCEAMSGGSYEDEDSYEPEHQKVKTMGSRR